MLPLLLPFLATLAAGGGSYLANRHNNQGSDKHAQESLRQIPQQTKQYYDPYINAGNKALPYAQEQYNNLSQDPGARLNEIGNSYHESPGFQKALQRALESVQAQSAGNGMLHSPQHQYNTMEAATELSNKDYDNYMNKALGLYGVGLQGQQNLISGGQNSGQDFASMIATSLGGKAGFDYAGRANRNQYQNNTTQNIAQTVSSLAAFANQYNPNKNTNAQT